MKSKKDYTTVSLEELEEYLKLDFPMQIGGLYTIQYSSQHSSVDDPETRKKSFSNLIGFYSTTSNEKHKVLKLTKYIAGVMTFEDKDGFMLLIHAKNNIAIVGKVNRIDFMIEKELGL